MTRRPCSRRRPSDGPCGLNGPERSARPTRPSSERSPVGSAPAADTQGSDRPRGRYRAHTQGGGSAPGRGADR
jgi:hypothetical protein